MNISLLVVYICTANHIYVTSAENEIRINEDPDKLDLDKQACIVI